MGAQNPLKGREEFRLDENVILIIPKNAATEQRVTFKIVAGARAAKPVDWIDIREFWFKDGPTEKPIPTRKGTMVKRTQLGRLVTALLRNVEPGELADHKDALLTAFRHATGE
jgi:hypothetical protein